MSINDFTENDTLVLELHINQIIYREYFYEG